MAVIAVPTLLMALPVAAQSGGADPSGTLKGNPVPKDLVAPGNGGVAGTGLGGTTGGPVGGTTGTGNSVSGPPGQGIDEGGTPKKRKSP